MYASFYKHLRASPLRRKAPEGLIKKLEECGFENIGGDLEVEFWLIRAARSMPEMSLLKSMFTPEIRARLARLLHRIEYETDLEDSVKKFWNLCDEEKIFTDYIAAFVRSVVIHRENFYKNLSACSSRPEIPEIIDEAESLYDVEPDGGLRKYIAVIKYPGASAGSSVTLAGRRTAKINFSESKQKNSPMKKISSENFLRFIFFR